MKGLLLAGGYGTRLRPLTFTGNKHMLPIANKPMLYYGLEHLITAGIKEIGVIVGPHKQDIVEALGDGSKFEVNLTYIDQPVPLGLAHGIMQAEEFLGSDSFVMYLGDNLLKNGITQMVQEFRENGRDCVVGVSHTQTPSNYGVVVFNENGEIETLVEKPQEFISNWALIGVYIFNKTVFKALKNLKKSARGEYEITDTINWLYKSGHDIGVKRVNGWWKDTGKTIDILEANRLVLEDQKTEIHGNIVGDIGKLNKIVVGENTVIDENVTLIGPIRIGSKCRISHRATIGPYVSISDNVKVKQANISNSIIMEGTSIDCDLDLTDSLIGRDVVIRTKSEEKKGHVLILGDKTTVLI